MKVVIQEEDQTLLSPFQTRKLPFHHINFLEYFQKKHPNQNLLDGRPGKKVETEDRATIRDHSLQQQDVRQGERGVDVQLRRRVFLRGGSDRSQGTRPRVPRKDGGARRRTQSGHSSVPNAARRQHLLQAVECRTSRRVLGRPPERGQQPAVGRSSPNPERRGVEEVQAAAP